MSSRIVVLFFIALFVSGCPLIFDEEGEPDDVGGGAEREYAEALGSTVTEAGDAHRAIIDAIGTASDDFTNILTENPPSETAREAYGPDLRYAARRHELFAVSAYTLLQTGEDLEDASPAYGSGNVVYSALLPESSFETRRQPLLFAAILAAGVALTAYGAYTGVRDAVDTRAKPVADKIASGTADELAIIAEELSLPPGSSRDEIQSAFEGLGVSDKTTAFKAIEERLGLAANGSTVNQLEASDVNRAVRDSAVELGETAVKTTVSLETTGTGGQGYGKALEMTGLSENAANLVDLAISAVSTATGEPLQPLDILATKLDVAAVSCETNQQTIPAPASAMTPDEAKMVLRMGGASREVADDAASTLAIDAANHVGTSTTNGDGSVVADLPTRLHAARVDSPTNATTVSVPEMGCAHIVVAAEGEQPQVFENVDTSRGATLEYRVDADGPTNNSTSNNSTSNNATPNNINIGSGDRDGDGYLDGEDNCPDIANRFQIDSDADGIGNECDDTACPEYEVVTGSCGGPNGCIEGFYCSRETIACEQEDCPAGAGRTYTLECCCDCWDDKSLMNVYDPCRTGYLLLCADRE